MKGICKASVIGITPAPAGKTRHTLFLVPPHKDHPRTCGENKPTLLIFLICSGSPPHLRGKLPLVGVAAPLGRITPAPAGKTGRRWVYDNSVKDHPRTCGENCQNKCKILLKRGSPPHLRGKLSYLPNKARAQRITPAPAGKTSWEVTSSLNIQGSPPHLRGKPLTTMFFNILLGITPAPAGKTLKM